MAHSLVLLSHPHGAILPALHPLLLFTVLAVILPVGPSPMAQTSQGQPGTLAMSGPPPTLTWSYPHAAPEWFVVRRILNGGPAQDVAILPGTSGEEITWEDTTLPASPTPVVAHYGVYAVQGEKWSEMSNRAIATFGGKPRLPHNRFTVVRADSSETQAEKHQAKLAGDGDPATFWHTRWSGAKPAPLPHWITLDLGAVLPVDGLAYLPRQDGSAQGRIAGYEVTVSQDNVAWSEPVATGVWVWRELALEQYVRWPEVEARYVRLTATSEASGGPWSAAAEIGLYAGRAELESVSLGECVVSRPEEKVTVLTCRQP